MNICVDLQFIIINKFLDKNIILNIFKNTIFQFKKYADKIKIKINKKNTDNDLKYIKGVKYCELFNCKNITSKGLKYLKNAEKLNLSLCNVSNDDMKYFKNTSYLNLSFCNISDAGLYHLKKIKIIGLSFCQNITKNGLDMMNKICTVHYNPYTRKKII